MGRLLVFTIICFWGIQNSFSLEYKQVHDLCIAVSRGDVKLLAAALQEGLDPNMVVPVAQTNTKYWYTPLASYADVACLKLLMN